MRKLVALGYSASFFIKSANKKALLTANIKIYDSKGHNVAA